MVQVPLVRGVRATAAADYVAALPVNLEPAAEESGISPAYLRSAIGARATGAGPGRCRGGIVWNGVLYRVLGTSLCSVAANGAVRVLADVGGAGPVSLDYGFDRLALTSGGRLHYWSGTALSTVTDPDLGAAYDVLWLSGYYVTTDGTSLVVTQLSDPLSVDPLKYGSAEADPDGVVALHKLRGELVALGDHTIQFYAQVGGSGFPFQAQPGATVAVGCCGRKAKAQFNQTLAWVGAGRGEALSVYLLDGGNAVPIANRAVADQLAAVADPTSIVVEARSSRDEHRLLVHLPDRTLVYLANASARLRTPVWYAAQSGLGQPYRLRNAVYAYGQWTCADLQSNDLGVLEDVAPPDQLAVVGLALSSDGQTYGQPRTVGSGGVGQRWQRPAWRPHKRFSRYLGLRCSSPGGSMHFGAPAGYEFTAPLLYNGGKGGVVHSVELVGLPGRGQVAWNALEVEVEPLSR